MEKKTFKINDPEEFSKLYKMVKLPIVDSDEYIFAVFSHEEINQIARNEHFNNINEGRLTPAIRKTLSGMLNLKENKRASFKDLHSAYFALRTAVMNVK